MMSIDISGFLLESKNNYIKLIIFAGNVIWFKSLHKCYDFFGYINSDYFGIILPHIHLCSKNILRRLSALRRTTSESYPYYARAKDWNLSYRKPEFELDDWAGAGCPEVDWGMVEESILRRIPVFRKIFPKLPVIRKSVRSKLSLSPTGTLRKVLASPTTFGSYTLFLFVRGNGCVRYRLIILFYIHFN